MTQLAPGDLAPDFTLPDATEQPVSLTDFRGRKVVLYVYPAALTPGCTKQACDFEQSWKQWQDQGYAVIGISPDAPAKLAKFAAKENLTFPLLSDPDKKMLTAYGAYGEKKLYGKTVIGVIRSTFVVDEQGLITLAKYNVRATGHVASLAKTLDVSLGTDFVSA